MTKKKTTVYLDEDLLRSTQVMAARKGMKDSQVFEEALRSYLGTDLLARVWSTTDLPEDEAMQIALEEIAKYRNGR